MITNPDPPSVASALGSSVELAWIPLGAGQHVVKFSGKLYEALTAFIGRRPLATSTTQHSPSPSPTAGTRSR